MEIISIVLGALIFAGTLWGSIKLLERYNPRNSFGLAAFIGVIFALVAPALGLFLFILPLVALGYLLVNFYELGILKSLGVIGLMIGANILLSEMAVSLARALA